MSSALRRPLSTMTIGYADLRKRLEAEGKGVVILPQLQEVSGRFGFCKGGWKSNEMRCT